MGMGGQTGWLQEDWEGTAFRNHEEILDRIGNGLNMRDKEKEEVTVSFKLV